MVHMSRSSINQKKLREVWDAVTIPLPSLQDGRMIDASILPLPLHETSMSTHPLQQSVHIAKDLDIKSALVLFRKSTCLPPTGIKIIVLSLQEK